MVCDLPPGGRDQNNFSPFQALAYARLLEEALQAEMQAYDAGTQRLQWIVDQIEARSLRRSRRRRSGTY